MSQAAILGGMAAAQAGLGFLSASQSGSEGIASSRQEATYLRQQSQFAQFNAGEKINENDYRAAHILSAIQSKTAAAGITSEGSPTQVFEASADEARITDMYTRYAANVQSSHDEFEAQSVEVAAKRANIAGYIGATSGAISSGIEAYGASKGAINPWWNPTSSSTGGTSNSSF